MAIDTTQEKYAVLYLSNWMVPQLPIIAAGGLDLADKKLLIHGYPTITWADPPIDAGNDAQWITRYRRRGKR